MRTVSVIVILIAVIVAVICTTQRNKHGEAPAQVAPAPAPHQAVANAAHSGRQLEPSGYILTDAQDPEFVQRVLPIVRGFFATLDRAGVNPIKGELPFNNVRIRHSPHGMDCRFLIGDSWTATTVESADYTGVIHFGQRGPDNPFRAISHANTNALIRLSRTAIKMPQVEAERIINQIADAFGVDRSKYEKPEIYPEKMLQYDLGMHTVQYRKKGSDPINQLNYTLNFSIKATSPTSAVLVMYSDTPIKR